MSLQITDHDIDGVAVMTLNGKLVVGDEAAALKTRVQDLLAADRRMLVLNVNDVTFVDSSGLGALVAVHHSALSKGGSLRLCNLGARFKTMLQMTKLNSVLQICDTEADAVQSFAK